VLVLRYPTTYVAVMNANLSSAQYDIVYSLFSLCIAAMGAAFVFFLGSRQSVGAKYRPALLVSALVVGIAGYHYVRIFNSWNAAYALDVASGEYRPTSIPFNDAYRYADWLLTVPLLLVELVSVLCLPRRQSTKLLTRLSIAAVLMIATGYPGEIATSMTARGIWGFVSTIPFVYILYVLWGELGKSLATQPPSVRTLVSAMRVLILATWGVYPIVYLLPQLGIGGNTAHVGVQIGYTIADIAAKAGYGVLIYAIARLKTDSDHAESAATAKAAEHVA
jgi:bacteriorhodopsin